MTVKFGTSGLRGLSSDLAGSVSARYATAFARFLLSGNLSKPGDLVMIGRDFRASSPVIASICMTAIRRAGLVPIDCGTVPTPALAHYAFSSNSACLMVTGSHIPADRNGIKFYRPDGEIGKQDEIDIVAIAEALSIEEDEHRADGGGAESRFGKASRLFFDRNSHILAPAALKGSRIGVYQHSTVARDLLVDLLTHYGATVEVLGRSEEFVAVDTEAVPADTCSQLSEWASSYRLDAIVSADGDGDRPLVSDEHGVPLRGDLLGLITAQFLGARTVATPVTSNSGIDRLEDVSVIRTKVGSPFVLAAMSTAGAAGLDGIVGFEANGGVLLGSDFELEGHVLSALPTRDCILPILATLRLIGSQPLSALSSRYGFPVALSDRVENFPTDRSAMLMDFLSASAENRNRFTADIGPVCALSEIDGLRMVLRDDSVMHLRPSGNAPEMRCYVEAQTKHKAETLLERGLQLIKGFDTPVQTTSRYLRMEQSL